MNSNECSIIVNGIVKIAGMVSATVIVIVALLTDGPTAVTLALGIAAGVAGLGGYAAGIVVTRSKGQTPP